MTWQKAGTFGCRPFGGMDDFHIMVDLVFAIAETEIQQWQFLGECGALHSGVNPFTREQFTPGQEQEAQRIVHLMQLSLEEQVEFVTNFLVQNKSLPSEEF